MMKLSYSFLLIACFFFLFSCRQEYLEQDTHNNSKNYDASKFKFHYRKKNDLVANSVLKNNVLGFESFLKKNGGAGTTASSKNAPVNVYTDLVYQDVYEEYEYENYKYSSFYLLQNDEEGYEQKMIIKEKDGLVTNRYLLKYKRIDGFRIDNNSFKSEELITKPSNGTESLISYNMIIEIGCSLYNITYFECGYDGHHTNGQTCNVTNEKVPFSIISVQFDPSCGGSSSDGSSGPGSTGSPSGSSGGMYVDLSVPGQNGEPPIIVTMPTSAPMYNIKGKITGTIKNPPDYNPLELTPDEIIQINSNDNIRLGIYQMLALQGVYPFNQGNMFLSEIVQKVKDILQWFRDHPSATWQDYYDSFLANPCEKANNTLNKNSEIKIGLKNLASQTANTSEHGIAVLANVTANTQNPVQILPTGTQGQIEFPQPASPYIIIAHTHNSPSTNTYSVPSWEDMDAISYAMQIDPNFADIDKFMFVTITADGTRYAFMIKDIDAFKNYFYQGDLHKNDFDMDLFSKKNINRGKYYYGVLDPNTNKIDPPKILENSTDYEQDLKYFMEIANNSGLNVFEMDASFTAFAQITINNNQIHRKDCQ